MHMNVVTLLGWSVGASVAASKGGTVNNLNGEKNSVP
jgi:hypothetical protein